MFVQTKPYSSIHWFGYASLWRLICGRFIAFDVLVISGCRHILAWFRSAYSPCILCQQFRWFLLRADYYTLLALSFFAIFGVDSSIKPADNMRSTEFVVFSSYSSIVVQVLKHEKKLRLHTHLHTFIVLVPSFSRASIAHLLLAARFGRFVYCC